MVFKVEKNSNIVYSDLRSFLKESQIKMDPEIRGDFGSREAETGNEEAEAPRRPSGGCRKETAVRLPGLRRAGQWEVCSRVRLHGEQWEWVDGEGRAPESGRTECSSGDGAHC